MGRERGGGNFVRPRIRSGSKADRILFFPPNFESIPLPEGLKETWSGELNHDSKTPHLQLLRLRAHTPASGSAPPPSPCAPRRHRPTPFLINISVYGVFLSHTALPRHPGGEDGSLVCPTMFIIFLVWFGAHKMRFFDPYFEKVSCLYNIAIYHIHIYFCDMYSFLLPQIHIK